MHRLTAPTNPNTAPTKTGEVQNDATDANVHPVFLTYEY